MRKSYLPLSLAALTLALASGQHLSAVTITSGNLGTLGSAANLTGTLANQGTVLEENFSLAASSSITVYTTSYGGGANVDGSSTTSGGFMPSLVLYSGTGSYVAGETFPSPTGNMDMSTGLVGDSYLSAAGLVPGTYILALSDFQVQQAPTATNLSDGFINYGGGASFFDAQGNLRTGDYSLNLTTTSNASSAATPEPGTFFLVIPALLGAIALRRRSVSVL